MNSSEIDVIQSMSSKFNESINEHIDHHIADDKTLKWRRLKHNKFAARRNLPERQSTEGLKEDSSVNDKSNEIVSNNGKTNRVLRRNKKLIDVQRNQSLDNKDKTIKTRGRKTLRTESTLIGKSTSSLKDFDRATELPASEIKNEQENGEKMETKLRRSERTQVNSPSKIEDVATEVKIESNSEQDNISIIDPITGYDFVRNSADEVGNEIVPKISLNESVTNETASQGLKMKQEPAKRGRKKLIPPPALSETIQTPESTSIVECIEQISSVKDEDDMKNEIKDTPPTTDSAIDQPPALEVKIPKKRGRKPGTKLKSKCGADNKTRNLPVKKSARITKDGNDSILATAIARKEKCNEQASPPQRLSRRIKPTPKILANEELRYGFEIQNNARLSISSENLDKDFSDLSPPKSEIRRSRSIDDKKSPNTLYDEQLVQKVPIKQLALSPESNTKPKIAVQQRPCPDPIEFLNEIKLAKINLNRSPEDNKKLNVRQKRRLIKMKEKHFNKLGLQRTNQTTDSSDGTSDSDADEFLPAKKIQVSSRPGVTLRLRRPTPDTNMEKILINETTPTKYRNDIPLTPNNGFDKADDLDLKGVKRKCENSLISSTKHKRLSDASGPIEVVQESKSVRVKPQDTNICLCNKISKYYTQKTLATRHCRAIDEIDNEHIGCSNEVEGDILKLYRPSVRALYMILCQDHKKRLSAHNSCAGCGIFCTQGRFILCSKNHFFHRDCAIKFILNTPFDPHNNKVTCPTLVLKCPHCGNDAPMHESLISMKCQNLPTYLPKQKIFNELSAKMSVGVHTSKSAPSPSTFLMDLDSIIPVSVVNLLNKMKIKLNYSKSTSFTTKDVLYAVHGKNIAQLAEILASGFDITMPLPEFRNGTCLHLVANFGDITMAYLTLSRAASIEFLNILDSELRTAIMCAVAGEKNDILKLLVQAGADVTIRGPEGMSALHLAAKNGNMTAVKIILQHYCSSSLYEFEKFINTVDEGGWTAIVWAADIGHSEMVTYFLNHGADVKIQDTKQNSLLHWATTSNDIDTVGPVLLNGCDVNEQNVNGDTALHIACHNSNLNICMLLLAHGANLDVINKKGNRPYDNIRDKEDSCASVLNFNSMFRKTACETEIKVLISDISKGREFYPIKLVKRYSAKERKLRGYELDHHMLPDFKYITKSIVFQNFIQIDRRVAQMRICCCSDNCISQSCQCSDVSVQNYYNAEGRLNDQFNFKERNKPMIFECNDVCGCNKLSCRNRVVQQGSRCAFQIIESTPKSKGWGVVALAKILKGTFVAEYTGEILNDSEAERRTDDSYFFDLGTSEHCIDANFFGNVSRFFNHSCEPNVVPIRVYFDHQDLCFPKIAFFASRTIEAGTEICFDYGEAFWIHKSKSFTCQCETKSCRFSEKTITATLTDYINGRRTDQPSNI